MDLQLSGKRALVTGSSSGIGSGIARVLASEGACVVIHGRNRARAQALADDILRNGGSASVVIGELATDTGAQAVAQAALSEGELDIFVNNAGGTTLEGNPSWFETPLSAWGAAYSQNVGPIVRLAHMLVPGMRERRWGRIINIGSGSGMQPNPFIPHYSATKAAINNVTLSLSKALADTGITVNTVSPGTVLTPALEVWMRDLARQKKWGDDWAEIERRYITEFFPLPVPRIGRVEDIGNMVAVLASPLSSYITGANVRIDGGYSSAIN